MLKNNGRLINNKKLLLLDFDGVVVPGPNTEDINGFIREAIWIVSEYYNISIDEANKRFKESMSKHRYSTISQYFAMEHPQIDIVGANMRVFGEYNKRKYNLNEIENRYISLALSKIREMGLDISILTNNSEEVVNEVLLKLGLNNIITNVIGAEQLNFVLKPNINAYHKALQILKHSADNTIFLDDSTTNVMAAMYIGITGVYIGDEPDNDISIRYRTLREFLRMNL